MRDLSRVTTQGTVLFSALREAVDARLPARARASQVKAILEGTPGVKPEQRKWTGLDDYLDAKVADGDLPVTKAELQGWLDANDVRVYEIGKGTVTPANNRAEVQTATQAYQQAQAEARDAQAAATTELLRQERPVTDLVMATATRVAEARGETWTPFQREQANSSAWVIAQRLLRGEVANNHPILRELTGDERNAIMDATRRGQELSRLHAEAEERLRVATRAYGNAVNTRSRELPGGTAEYKRRGLTLAGALEPLADYREYLLVLPSRAGTGEGDPRRGRPDFTANHWGEPNVIAHVRVTDRVTPDGKRVMFVEEVQSDWHQAAAEKVRREDWVPGTPGVFDRAGYMPDLPPADQVRQSPHYARMRQLHDEWRQAGQWASEAGEAYAVANRAWSEGLDPVMWRVIQRTGQQFGVNLTEPGALSDPWVIYERDTPHKPVHVAGSSREGRDYAYDLSRRARPGEDLGAVPVRGFYEALPLEEWAGRAAEQEPDMVDLAVARQDAERDYQRLIAEANGRRDAIDVAAGRDHHDEAALMWRDVIGELEGEAQRLLDAEQAARQAFEDASGVLSSAMAGEMADDRFWERRSYLTEGARPRYTPEQRPHIQGLAKAYVQVRDDYSEISNRIEVAARAARKHERYLTPEALHQMGLTAPPPGPFMNSAWRELPAKHMLQLAVAGDYDYLGWTPGEPHGFRYDEGAYNVVQGLVYDPRTDDVIITRTNGTNPRRRMTPRELDATFGPRVTEFLLDPANVDAQTGTTEMVGADIWAMGSQADRQAGLQRFYDDILVNEVNRLTKRYGVEVQDGPILLDRNKPEAGFVEDVDESGNKSRQLPNAYTVHLVPLTPEAKAGLARQPLMAQEGRQVDQTGSRDGLDGAVGADGAVALSPGGRFRLPPVRNPEALAAAGGAVVGALEEQAEIEDEQERTGREVGFGERLSRTVNKAGLVGLGAGGLTAAVRRGGAAARAGSSTSTG